MKSLIEKAKDRIVTFEQLLDSRMNRLVRSGELDPEPLEVRNAILKEIQEQVVRDSNGGAVFPHAQVVVELLTGALPQGASLEPLTGDRLQAAARQALAELDCRVPSHLSLQIRRMPQPADDWPPDSVYRLRFDDVSSRHDRSSRAVGPLLTLTLSPESNPQAFHMLEDRIDVGSVAEVRDRDGRLVRRNTVSISDPHDPKRSVSRRHAHIMASPDAYGRIRYVLHDDASTYGTRVVRRGETIAVPPGTSGVRLRDGDEVYFGAARAMVSIGAGSAAAGARVGGHGDAPLSQELVGIAENPRGREGKI
jgi:FHA domain-containing protein